MQKVKTHTKLSIDNLNHILCVLQQSGVRGLGLSKRVDENKNLIQCIDGAYGILCNHAWAKEYALDLHSLFSRMQSSLDCLRFTHSFTPLDDFFQTLLAICGTKLEVICLRKQQNADLFSLINNTPNIYDKISYASSALEDNEIFFQDMIDVFGDIIEIPNPCIIEWPGIDYTECTFKYRQGKQGRQQIHVDMQ